MVDTFDFTTIDNLLSSMGGFLEAFVMLISIVFNNLIFLLLFCFFIAFIWSTIKIFDLKRYYKHRGKE